MSPRGGRAIAGAICVTVAAVAFVSAISALKEVWAAEPTRGIGRRLAMKETFRRDALDRISVRLEGIDLNETCNVDLLKTATLVRAHLVESTIAAADAAQIDRRFDEMEAAARALLRCSPYQGLGWFALYWTSLNKGGPTPSALAFLDMSYATAPREAWIALVRNSPAIKVMDALSPVRQDDVIAEWADLLKSGFFIFAAETLVRAKPSQQLRLAERTANVDGTVLKLFGRYLDRIGADVALPTLPQDLRRVMR